MAKLAANAMIFDAIEFMAEAAAVVGALGADRARFLSIMTDADSRGFSSEDIGVALATMAGHSVQR